MNSESEENFDSSSEARQAEIESSDHFSSSVPVNRNVLPSESYGFEEEVPEEASIHNSQKEPGYLDKEIDFASLDINKLLQLSSDLKVMREQLFLTTEKLRDQKDLYETAIADRSAHIEYLEFELGKVERERDTFKIEKEELEFRLNQAEKSFKGQLEETEKKIGSFENNRIEGLRSKQEEVSYKMRFEMAKVEFDNMNSQLQALTKRNNELESNNEELNRVIQENIQTSANNQNSILNIGIPAYRSQVTLSIEDFNALDLTPQAINIDSQTIYEFCHLLLEKLKQKQARVQYFESNDFERKAIQFQNENLKLQEDLKNLELVRDKLINLNEGLDLKNRELMESGVTAAGLNEIIEKMTSESRAKDDNLLQKDKIIQELQRLIGIYESELLTKEHIKDVETEMEEEITGDESKENILNSYNKLKQEWVILMKDYKDLREAVKAYQKKDEANAGSYEETFLNSLLKENNQLKESVKKAEEESKRYYEHAVEKVQQFKNITKKLLGWDLRIKDEVIEMRSTLSTDENQVLVLREEGPESYVILDIEDFAKNLFTNYPHLSELKDLSFPLFFAYVSVLMKPDLKELFFIL